MARAAGTEHGTCAVSFPPSLSMESMGLLLVKREMDEIKIAIVRRRRHRGLRTKEMVVELLRKRNFDFFTPSALDGSMRLLRENIQLFDIHHTAPGFWSMGGRIVEALPVCG